MCGILAMHTFATNGFSRPAIDNFEKMLVLTSFRGKHSTGLSGLALHKDLPSSIVKVLGTPDKLDTVPHIDDFWDRAFFNYSSILGHCRAATVGNNKDAKNAHPFKNGHITLVHNGTLSNFEALKTEFKLPDIQVDSDLISKLFSLHSPQEIIPKLHGAYALVWFDEKKKTMNWVRNAMRPLWVAKTRAEGTVLLASEKATLEWNASRHIVFYDSLEEIPTMTIFTLTAGSREITSEPIKMPVYTPPARGYTQNKYYGGDGDEWDDYIPWNSSDGLPSGNRQLPLIQKENEIKPGMEIEFEVLDYEYESFPTTNGKKIYSTKLELYNDFYRDYEFFGVLAGNESKEIGHVDENRFASAGMRIKGVVSRIIESHHANIPSRVSMISLRVVQKPSSNVIILPDQTKKDEQAENLNELLVLDSYNGTVQLSKRRVKKLLESTCEWCDKPHPADSLARHASLMFVEKSYSNRGADSFVCVDCVVNSQTCPTH